MAVSLIGNLAVPQSTIVDTDLDCIQAKSIRLARRYGVHMIRRPAKHRPNGPISSSSTVLLPHRMTVEIRVARMLDDLQCGFSSDFALYCQRV